MVETEQLNEHELRRGAELLHSRLLEIIDAEPEVTDIHRAFEMYSMRKYSLGNSAGNHITGGSKDIGIDFYSHKDRVFSIGQCKIPESDWLEANPTKPKVFGSQSLSDTRDALRYLFGESDLKPNEQIKRLYALIQNDQNESDFKLTFYIIVYGRLNARAKDDLEELRRAYANKVPKIVLVEMDSLVSEFLVGSGHNTDVIQFDVHIVKDQVLRAQNYCYFLAKAGDLFRAFSQFGWRLFDLNLRYEVRNSAVNGEIIHSLSYSRTRKNFHHYNNGLIIITDNYSIKDHDTCMRLSGAQIVNGLQTVKSIYNAVTDKHVSLQELDDECVVPVKVIKNNEARFVAQVVRATNNQNPMAQRNLRSNNAEQKSLRRSFQQVSPRWFYQVKEGEWDSLTSEQSRFFEQVVGYKAAEFKPVPTKKAGRVIDNQESAKAWLAFIGFADEAGDRVTHFFSEEKIYDLAFGSRPTSSYWTNFAASTAWDKGREELLERRQGEASQYLLAYFIWQYVNGFVPSPQKYREEALNEGVVAGNIKKASGSFTSSEREQDAYLADSDSYQTWRLMANMKELLAECVSQVLARKYGSLDSDLCSKLLASFEADAYRSSGETREAAQKAATAGDLHDLQVFGRVLRMLHFVSQQFWESKKQQLLSTSRLRTYLLKRDIAASFKTLVWEYNGRINLDRVWKPQGKSFLDSLPPLRNK